MPQLTSAMIWGAVNESLPLVTKKVPCPELGQDAYTHVKQLTCAEAEVIERIAGQNSEKQLEALKRVGYVDASPMDELSTMSEREANAVLADPPSIRLPLVAATMCDEAGICLVQTDADRQMLAKLPPALIRRLHTAAWALNSVGDDEVEAAVKNYARRQTSDSGIVLLANGVALPESASNS